jgi:phage shock protein C
MKTLYRSSSDVALGGVCSGIAEAFKVDVVFVRLAWLGITLATGVLPGVVTYMVAWMIVPQRQGDHEKIMRIYRSSTDRKLGGICGGLAQKMGVDPTIIRLALVFAAVVTAVVPGMIVYLVGWIVIPVKEADPATADAEPHSSPA